MDIRKLYDDEYLLVVDKPSGIVVNRAKTQEKNYTLQDWVDENVEWKSLGVKRATSFWERSGVVHRLDKETSGVIILAKDERSFKNLQKQFEKRKVKKKYITLVYGRLPDTEVGSEIAINAPIDRNPASWGKFAVVANGKEAETKVKVVELVDGKMGEFSLLECCPKTGRTHQIRVHLASLGTPVIGDKLYSGRTRTKKYGSVFKRQFLHATEISFVHPIHGERVVVESKLPEDLRCVLDLLRK